MFVPPPRNISFLNSIFLSLPKYIFFILPFLVYILNVSLSNWGGIVGLTHCLVNSYESCFLKIDVCYQKCHKRRPALSQLSQAPFTFPHTPKIAFDGCSCSKTRQKSKVICFCCRSWRNVPPNFVFTPPIMKPWYRKRIVICIVDAGAQTAM